MRWSALLVCLPAAAAAQPCRVLVNVEDPTGQHRVADVRLADQPTMEVVAGLAAGQGSTITRVYRVQDGSFAPGVDARFETLVADAGAGEKTWLGGRQEIGRPERGDVGPWTADFATQVTGIFGDLVSVSASGYGFTGGAHDFDDRSAATLRAPTGERVDLAALLGAPYLEAARANIEAARKDREDGWEGGPEARPESLQNAYLAGRPGGLAVEVSVSCCSWAENHNYHDMRLAVPAPEALKAVVPDAQGWFVHGQCSLQVEADGTLRTRERVVGHLPGRLLGIAWLDAGAPPLRARKVDEAAAKAALTRARSLVGKAEDGTVLAVLHSGLAAVPDDSEILGEIGYLHLKAGRLPLAEAATRVALEGALTPDLDGRLRYNLGRVAELQGDRARARRLYRASLARRPNPVVKKALAALEAPAR